MDTSLIDFRHRCLDAVLDLLWRQWCSLGVAGHAQAASSSRLIDPEALLLATSSLGRHEPRLFDEALDWLSRYCTLMNIQRLKNLQKATSLGDDLVLSSMADWLATQAGQHRWKTLVATGTTAKPVQPLFAGADGIVSEASDPYFAAHGLQRPRFEPRGMSRPPDPYFPPNLVLSFRALIGVSARVEVILCLAGGPAEHASEIARMTGYAPRTLQSLLQEMTLSGHLLTHEPEATTTKVRRGAHRRYHVQPSHWSFLTQGRPLPQWFCWPALFSLVRQVIDAIPSADEKARHPAVVSSKLRSALSTHGQALAAAGFLAMLPLRPRASGEELLETLSTHLPHAIAGL